jgi:hypothetical protein
MELVVNITVIEFKAAGGITATCWACLTPDEKGLFRRKKVRVLHCGLGLAEVTIIFNAATREAEAA